MLDRFRVIVRALLSVALVASVLVLSAPTAQAETPGARIEGWLETQMGTIGADDQLLVLVGASSALEARTAIVAAGATPFRSFEKVGFSSAMLTPGQIRAVAATPGIDYLQGNRSLAPQNETATKATRVQQAEDLYDAQVGGGLTGRGVGIAIVDSGMAGDHEMFLNDDGSATRLLNIKQTCALVTACSTPGEVEDAFFLDATGTDTDVLATGGHGTHVAAIAGGRAVTTAIDTETRGVATDSSLYGLGAGAAIFVLNASASLNWVLEHHADPCAAFPARAASAPGVVPVDGCAPIKVVNNSYGGACGAGESNCSTEEYNPDDILVRLSEALVLEGVVPVWAAGNGADLNDTDPPPNDGTRSLTNTPGQSPLPGILMVANYYDGDIGSRDNALAPSSSRGKKGLVHTYPDISAPGTNILAACRPWLPVCTSAYGDPNYGEITGTSMAAPHVAGIVALLVQANPDLTPGQIEDLLEDTAHEFGDQQDYEADISEGKYRNILANGPMRGTGPAPEDSLTHFSRGHGLVDLTKALADLDAGRILSDPGPGVGATCVEDAHEADVTGDATSIAGLANVPGDASDPNFDITHASMTLTETLLDGKVLRFEVGLLDVADGASASTGEYLRYAFSAGNVTYQMTMSRDLDNGVEDFRVVILNGIGDTTLVASDLAGSFDADADVITADLPVDAIPGVTFGPGDVLNGIDVLVQRQVGTSATGGATLTADELSASCPFVLAGGTTSSGAPLAAGAAGASLLLLLVATRRRRLLTAVVTGVVALGVVSSSLVPAQADMASFFRVRHDGDTATYSVTVDSANAERSCVDSDTGAITQTEDSSCFIVPVGITAPGDLHYLRVTAVPGEGIGQASDLDVYLVDRTNKRVISSAAGIGVPRAGSHTEIAFAQVPVGAKLRVVVASYENLPGATYELKVEGFAKASYID